jgi:hypothetical protein
VFWSGRRDVESGLSIIEADFMTLTLWVRRLEALIYGRRRCLPECGFQWVCDDSSCLFVAPFICHRTHKQLQLHLDRKRQTYNLNHSWDDIWPRTNDILKVEDCLLYFIRCWFLPRCLDVDLMYPSRGLGGCATQDNITTPG